MISIIIPIAKKEKRKIIKRCLDSIERQSFKYFEVVIATSAQVQKKYTSLFNKYNFIKIVAGCWNKSEARNKGVEKAKGEYLLNCDSDMELSPSLLSELAQRIKKNEKAVVIPYQYAENVNFWGNCRALERKIILNNPPLEAPIFIKKSLFKKVDGFDEFLDPLDDWGLQLALEEKGIKFTRTKTIIKPYSSPTLI
jgi:glycosyltransferase involved in cell wall biosynthesis